MRGARRDRTQNTCIDGEAIFETPGEEVEREVASGGSPHPERIEREAAQKEHAPSGAGSLKVREST
jgi:hypothetical protein